MSDFLFDWTFSQSPSPFLRITLLLWPKSHFHLTIKGRNLCVCLWLDYLKNQAHSISMRLRFSRCIARDPKKCRVEREPESRFGRNKYKQICRHIELHWAMELWIPFCVSGYTETQPVCQITKVSHIWLCTIPFHVNHLSLSPSSCKRSVWFSDGFKSGPKEAMASTPCWYRNCYISSVWCCNLPQASCTEPAHSITPCASCVTAQQVLVCQ